MSEHIFSSEAGFTVRVSDRCIEAALELAAQAGPNETGGIIIGFYDDELVTATITELSEPPSDSKATRSAFWRGVRGLLSRLTDLWSSPRRQYYIGEWHFHPFEEARASDVDHEQMYAIARSPRYKCPEPILLILGGDPKSTWSVSVMIYLAEGDVIALQDITQRQRAEVS